ncbi:MAG: hypothetical protein LBJ97_01775, partial [Mycoplasmataceae bacterium]|nr:hypothetical protein [Mycoplasmataceae bacterium]
ATLTAYHNGSTYSGTYTTDSTNVSIADSTITLVTPPAGVTQVTITETTHNVTTTITLLPNDGSPTVVVQASIVENSLRVNTDGFAVLVVMIYNGTGSEKLEIDTQNSGLQVQETPLKGRFLVNIGSATSAGNYEIIVKSKDESFASQKVNVTILPSIEKQDSNLVIIIGTIAGFVLLASIISSSIFIKKLKKKRK